MFREMLVYVDDDETSVAVLEDHKLVEIYMERSNNQRLVGNIYKGKVENVLPGMQAAFVDIGLDRNAFLYVQDAMPPRKVKEDGRGAAGNPTAAIGDILKPGQELMVQVAKEPLGGKGARVTTHLTLPGRYLVLMPTVDYIGISRRIESEAERSRLKKLAQEVKTPGIGVIVRTVAEGVSDEELAADIRALTALWERVQHRNLRASAPSILHRDAELLYRMLRDLFSADVNRMLVNNREAFEKVQEMVEATAPHLRSRVNLDTRDLFILYDVPSQVQQALRRKVWLKCGGYVVIDQMEALTAVDVNTGKFVGSTNLADTVLKTNLEAAVEIARQLRLRNIGGIIVIDFIDMESPAHQEMVIKALEEEFKKDKTKTAVLGFTRLGMVEMTRKKARRGLESELQKDCPYCEGTGKVLSEETVCLRAKKELMSLADRTTDPAILVEAYPAVAGLLIGSGGSGLRQLETKTGKQLIVRGVETMHLEEVRMRGVSRPEEAAQLAVPVKVGQMMEVRIDEPHAANSRDGIARVQGFVIDVTGAASLVGQAVQVEITKVFRTSAKARLLPKE
ncbi:ribonuclease G [Clostridiales bacterium PH28_bin88]|nr:ribonuclease G [Clostridiales bacterium PH28_bin88]